ncbi:putative Sensory histidine kinase/response regulator [Desulfamplus magnetovallimortis]|uniref:histidine kinase n=1 Tax=Desulfamplus magnetovallimortis TaxID=1246637 RepID=A0A1W1H5F2_9BACT|nr:response regulator [Desulfamplus magnetovallimortis]SLM27605.1 putative Sensory histidine kinase/response regulator [Desulfamplus magnetovallimortis]
MDFINQNLLIVDDNPEILDSLSELLEDEGFELRAAKSGEDAIDILSEFNPAVILSDMNMPGMSGLELLKEVRKSNHVVQFVVLTGYATVRNVAESMADNGAFAYLQKPIMDFEILFSTLRQAMQKYQLLQENKLWEERLKKANATFEAIFENMDAVVYVADMQTYELIYANTKFKRLFGFDGEPDSYRKKLCWQVLQKANKGPCDFCTNLKLVDSQGKPFQPYTWEFYNPVLKRHFSIKDQAIYWHDGRLVRLEIAMDMTKYRKISREMQKAKRFKAIGVLAGGIAHDLNNTLAAILGNLNLAQLIVANSEADEYFDAAEAGIMQAKELSGKLLGLARGEEPVKKRVDMKKLAEAFISNKECKTPIRLDVADPLLDYPVDGDAEQIKTVLYNLTVNATEAMDFKGEVRISIHRHFSSTHHCEYVVTGVHDTGRGITASDVEKVFDPYYTTKFPGADKGTGLGLSIAYSIVRKHDGFIDIDSVEGKGTRVDVYIPVAGNVCDDKEL